MSHTPTPWCSIVSALENIVVRVPGTTKTICIVGPAGNHDDEADAAFIVEACNAYERLKAINAELLAACVAVVETDGFVGSAIMRKRIDAMKLAIAHAKEKP